MVSDFPNLFGLTINAVHIALMVRRIAGAMDGRSTIGTVSAFHRID